MNEIAALKLIQLKLDGKREPFQIKIGKPHYEERGSWACPVLITNVDEKVMNIYGEDSMQALSLGVRFVHNMLQGILNNGHRLLELRDDLENVDFPLDAYFGADEQDGAANESPLISPSSDQPSSPAGSRPWLLR